MVRFFVAVFSLWRCSVIVEAQSADGELKRSLVRKHQEHPAQPSALQLGATGDIVHMKKSEGASSQTPATCIMEAFPKFGDSMCGEAYIQGTADTNDCADAAKHSIILQQSLCDEARKQAGVTTATALVPYNETKLCPIGCSNRNGAFFYNPSGDCPHSPGELGGIPICRRYRYQNSTTSDSNDDCPSDYERIMTAAECRAAAACQGLCQSDEWPVIGQRDGSVADDDRPAWADNYNIFPKGCFIRDEDGCAYFNDPMTGTDHARTADPTDPKGIGLCKITGTANFPDMGASITASR